MVQQTPPQESVSPSEQEVELEQSPTRDGNPKRLKSLSLFVGLAIGVVGSMVVNQFLGQNSQPSPSPATDSPPPAAVEQVSSQTVTVTSVEAVTVPAILRATGTVAPVNLLPITSGANNLTIEAILVDEGAYVERGQLLAQLDTSVLEAQLAQAKSRLVNSQARLAELRAGAKPQEIAQAQARINAIAARVTQAQSDLELMAIKLERNENLAAEGAISRDRLDEVRNEQRRAQANVAETEASLMEAQQVLAELQAGTRTEVIDQAIADIAQDQAQIKLINAQLANARVVAPTGGKIARRYAQVGDTANGGKVLFDIIDQGRLELQLKVPENQLGQIRPGQTVAITADHNQDLKLNSQVQEIVPIIDAQTRQGTVNVTLPNTAQLQAGMFLRGEITVNSKNGLSVPMEAVLPQSTGQANVFVVQPDQTVMARPVTMGEILPEQKIEILTGLTPQDRVVVKGAAFVRDGDRVDVAPE